MDAWMDGKSMKELSTDVSTQFCFFSTDFPHVSLLRFCRESPITQQILNSTMVRFLAHLLEIELAIEMAPRHRHGIHKHAACLKIEWPCVKRWTPRHRHGIHRHMIWRSMQCIVPPMPQKEIKQTNHRFVVYISKHCCS